MPSLLPTKPTAKALLRCVIVEDQVMFEQLFRLTLESVGGVDVVAVAHTAKKGIAACRAHLPDLLLLDLALPDKSGLVVAEALAKYRPEARTCQRSLQNAPPVVTSKCTTFDGCFSRFFGFVLARGFSVPLRGGVRGTVVPCLAV